MGKADKYKILYEDDKDNLDLLFSNIDDPNQTMDSIINYIMSNQGQFGKCDNWDEFIETVQEHCEAGNKGDKEITVSSWRKFKRIVNKYIKNGSSQNLFARGLKQNANEVRL